MSDCGANASVNDVASCTVTAVLAYKPHADATSAETVYEPAVRLVKLYNPDASVVWDTLPGSRDTCAPATGLPVAASTTAPCSAGARVNDTAAEARSLCAPATSTAAAKNGVCPGIARVTVTVVWPPGDGRVTVVIDAAVVRLYLTAVTRGSPPPERVTCSG